MIGKRLAKTLWRAGLPLLALFGVLYGGAGEALAANAQVTIGFANLGTGRATVSGTLVGNANKEWTVLSTDANKTKNLAQGARYTVQVDVTSGAYAVTGAPQGTGGAFPTLNYNNAANTSHTQATYHTTYTFTFTVPTSNSTLTVTFGPRYTLTGKINGSTTSDGSGTLTLNDGTSVLGSTYWAEGEIATISAAAATGYGISALSGDTNQWYNIAVSGFPTSQVVTSKAFSSSWTNFNIAATFTRVYTITPQIDYGGVPGSGSITPAVPQRVQSGGSVFFTIAASAGSKISKVDVDGATVVENPNSPYTTAAPYFTNVTADHTVKAWFYTPAVNVTNYCSTPSFLATTIKPNLLLMLDNSASMFDLGYNANTFCYDNSFNKDYAYYGNFETADSAAYSYNFTSGVFEPAASSNPGSCNYGTAYFCLRTDNSGNATTFWARGNFLNWLAASKLDQLKKILTGGKYDSTSRVLISESRGCLGRRFIKEIPATDWTAPTSGSAPNPRITFGVRGPNMYDPENVSQSIQGGKTRIEIFKGNYNATACTGAVQDWSNAGSIGDVQYGGTTNNTSACVGGDSNLKSNAFNHITHLCYRALSGGNLNGELGPLQGDCQAIYPGYGNDPAGITNENAGDAICSSSLLHPQMDGDFTGYIGKCITYPQLTAGDPTATPPVPPTYDYAHPTWDDTCTVTEVRHYCAGVHQSDVTDPTDSAVIARSGGDTTIVPSFIMDAGLAALGAPIGTMLGYVSRNGAPTGLINEFSSVIDFGTMEFNLNGTGNSAGTGSTSECSDTGLVKCAKACTVSATGAYAEPYKECWRDSDCSTDGSVACVAIPKRDGSRIQSYIGDPLGDHATANTLIKRIDDMQGRTWTPLAEAFYNAIGYYSHRDALRLNDGDFSMDASKDPSAYSCRDNYVLLLSDGGSTVDQNSTVNALAAAYPGPSNQTGSCSGGYLESKGLDDLVYLANRKNIRTFDPSNPAAAPAPTAKREKIITYVINTGKTTAGTDECLSPSLLLDHAAANGGTGETSAPIASDAATLQAKMREVFSKVASRVTSGTAASILSNSEGSGANLLQAIFYPMKTFDQLTTRVSWIGELQNFWYYIDPFIGNSTVREDTNGDRVMNLVDDYVARFAFDPVDAQTKVTLTVDSDGNGLGDAVPAAETRFISNNPAMVSADNVKSLWRAGRQLWLMDANARHIYTQISGALTVFDHDRTGVDTTVNTHLDTSLNSVFRLFQTSSQAEADTLIDFVRGNNISTLRDRRVAIPAPVGPDSTLRVWKLGDIISSTPRVQSTNKLNTYHMAPPAGFNDGSYEKFFSSADYRNRGMAYVGANDGMLHAFKAGKLTVSTSGNQKATLSAGTLGVLGKEEWAFVPKNAIPYLTYLSDPNYPHLNYVDGTPTIADVSIARPSACDSGTPYWNCAKDGTAGTNWSTVIVTGMGLGGATRNSTTSGTGDFVKTPVDGVGYSSYFALDVTNQSFDATTGVRDPSRVPTFLWEFAHAQLGYAMSGPALVHISARAADGVTPDISKNGRWFAVFGSGPTGPIDGSACQFKGKSDQNLRLFVVDMNPSGGWTLNTNYWIIDTGIPYAFAGSISSGVLDADRWNKISPGFYQDDAVYLGYVRNTASDGSGTWTDGGVLRLLTKESLDPSTWTVAKVIDGIGPVTTNIARLQDRKNHKLWLYFGSGRYFYNQDDMSNGRRLFGIKEPCYTAGDTLDKSCGAADQVNRLLLTNQTTNPSDALSIDGPKGWYINLAAEDSNASLGAERSVTDAVAMTNGAVFFTTYKPTGDPCQFGGKSRLWAVKYDTGGRASDAALQGKALVQISTGEFKEIDLKTAFDGSYGRAMLNEMTGKPPGDPPPIVTKSNLKPVRKVLHVQERQK